MTVNDIFKFLDSYFPVRDALNFDNVGIIVGNPENEITKVLVALDCTLETVNFAIKNGCDLIITHHPVIFDPLKRILFDTVHYRLIKNSISVISMHTNLDIGSNGVNETLCKIIGLNSIKSYVANDGFKLLCGSISPISATDFANTLKSSLGGVVKYVNANKPINKVLVCCGSGGNYIEDALLGGFDALITSEVKHHQFLYALDNGISLFDAGHYNTEDVIVEPLKILIENYFKNVTVFTLHPNLINFA